MNRPDDLSHLRGRRVIAAMSGGVDSSVMAALLQRAGAEVVGVFLHVWDYSRDEVRRHGSCCATEDAYDARRVADMLGIDFYNMDMREAFRRDVVDPFIAGYASGHTPNPCERCNRFVKFGALLAAADRLEAGFVATGHYVRRRDDATGVRLFRGTDADKDQSYFLATTGRARAARLLFPVGHLHKEETRRIAREAGLPTASKRESQDICFIPGGDRLAFLRRQGAGDGLVPGDIVDVQGRVLGRHDGIAAFTIGQRRGLGLSGGPWRVVALDARRARVVVAPPAQACMRAVHIARLSWIRMPANTESVSVQLRYQARPVACTVVQREDEAEIRLAAPQPLTAPGQVAALYAGDELLGGGIVRTLQPLDG